ncbi:hypothetical protein [Shewanella sp. Isolate11]|uniref:hypothetical protein n=1 Tax=Shewanella sp. Isolate11 TaxID=2908530 RepID=UPI001EFEE857|nr:hypothetical protein [Shewanella sp. Isolate11]MCG9695390.1 hypothetical protein [Shewanella sp. Isolate11]
MDITYNNFLYEGYWWISLLGGLHCIGLGTYIRYLYRDRHGNHKLLGTLFTLVAVYFLTGLVNPQNSPFPLQLFFILLVPTYFLLTPLLYLYCYQTLHNTKRSTRRSWHFFPAGSLAFIISIAFMFDSDFRLYTYPESRHAFNHVTLLASILPVLLSLHACIYFYCILKLLKRFKNETPKAHHNTIKAIKLKWLLVLTLAMLINWLIRTFMVIFPVYFGDQVNITSQAFTNIFLLLTVYGLAIYGLKQITITAYLRGSQSHHQRPSPQRPAYHKLLSNEEINFLQQILNDEKKA